MDIRVRVGAIIVKDGSILLVKHKKGESVYWLLPGGGVEPKETLQQALAREVKEELSLNTKPEEMVFVSDSINEQEGKHIIQIVFNCPVVEGDIKVNPDHRLVDAAYFKIDEINDLIFRPNIKEHLINYLKNGSQSKVYLGNVWE